MLHSMTGYGKAKASHEGTTVTADIRTLNSRYCDVALRMPVNFRSKDVELRGWLSGELLRGKIDVMITVSGIAASGSINGDLFKLYYEQVAVLAKEVGAGDSNLVNSILQLPDVVGAEENALNEGLWNKTFAAVKEATAEVIAFRRQEGAAMHDDLIQRLDAVRAGLREIQKVEPDRHQRARERIRSSLAEWTTREQVDKNRFEQELLYYLEKMDVNEELVRLESHLTHFTSAMGNDDIEKGKKLGFIAQEMTREVNTVSSKANDAAMQKVVVSMKDELEKVKELLLNVL